MDDQNPARKHRPKSFILSTLRQLRHFPLRKIITSDPLLSRRLLEGRLPPLPFGRQLLYLDKTTEVATLLSPAFLVVIAYISIPFLPRPLPLNIDAYEFFSTLFGASWSIILSIFAIIAGYFGFKARRDLERGPFLIPALSTSLPTEDYLSILYNRVYKRSSLMGFCFLSVMAGILIIYGFGTEKAQLAILRTPMGPILEARTVFLQPVPHWINLLLCLPGILVLSFQFGVGFFLRSVRALRLPQKSFGQIVNMVLDSALMCLLLAPSFLIRTFVTMILQIAFTIRGYEGLSFSLAVILVETPALMFRLTWITRTWNDMHATLPREIRMYILKDDC